MADLTTDPVDSTGGRILGLFAKAWDAGKVKTRLAKTLGDQAAVEVYRSLLSLNLMSLGNVADHRTVAFSPADEVTKERFRSYIATHKPTISWDLEPQIDGDLGTRMSSFFQQRFDLHGPGSRVILIGSDALWLTREIMDKAFQLLESHDVVFGPSTDGGYYLVGMSVKEDSVFREIDWSTEKVLEQSLAKCEAANLKVAQLEPLTDIDDENDLRKEVQRLRDMDSLDIGATRQIFLADIDQILGEDWP